MGEVVVCDDVQAEITSALSCCGQRVSHVNVNAIHPDDVDAKLGETANQPSSL